MFAITFMKRRARHFNFSQQIAVKFYVYEAWTNV